MIVKRNRVFLFSLIVLTLTLVATCFQEIRVNPNCQSRRRESYRPTKGPESVVGATESNVPSYELPTARPG